MDNVLKVKVLKDGAIVPSKLPGNSGYDLYALIPEEPLLILEPDQGHMFDTGIAVEVPVGYGFLIGNRGSRGSVGLVYGAHVVDAIYRGEVFLDLHNISDKFMVFTDLDMDGFKRYLVAGDFDIDSTLACMKESLLYPSLDTLEDWVTLIPRSKALAQGMIIPTMNWDVEVVTEMSETERGSGKLGSSDK